MFCPSRDICEFEEKQKKLLKIEEKMASTICLLQINEQLPPKRDLLTQLTSIPRIHRSKVSLNHIKCLP